MIALEMYSDFEYIIFLTVLKMSLGLCWANCKLDLKLANALNWERKYFDTMSPYTLRYVLCVPSHTMIYSYSSDTCGTHGVASKN